MVERTRGFMEHHLQLCPQRCTQRRNAFVNSLKCIPGILCSSSSLKHEEQGSHDTSAFQVFLKCLPLFGKGFTHQPLKTVPPDGVKHFGWSSKCNPSTGRRTAHYHVYASNHLGIQSTSLIIHPVDHAVATQRFPLFHLPLVAHCKFVSSLCTAAGKNLSAGFSRHALSEAMCVFPFPPVRLKRALHPQLTPFLSCRLRLKQKKRVAQCRTILPFGSSPLLVYQFTKKPPDIQHPPAQ
jgi:hypothetical protein